jgi:hypothetical protein
MLAMLFQIRPRHLDVAEGRRSPTNWIVLSRSTSRMLMVIIPLWSMIGSSHRQRSFSMSPERPDCDISI